MRFVKLLCITKEPRRASFISTFVSLSEHWFGKYRSTFAFIPIIPQNIDFIYTLTLISFLQYGHWTGLLSYPPSLEPLSNIHGCTWYRLLPHLPSLEPPIHIHHGDWTRLFLSQPSLGQKVDVGVVVRNDSQVYFCCLLVRELRREPSMLIQ